MQVSRPMNDNLRRFPLVRDVRVAIAPMSSGIGSSYQLPTKSFSKMVPAEEVRLNVLSHCARCGIPVRQHFKSLNKLQCQGCRRSELQRLGSLENIRPASPITGTPTALNSITSDGRVHPSWMVEVQREQETPELLALSSEHSRLPVFRVTSAPADGGSFRSMEVLTCFRSEVHRGLRLLLQTATAEKWHMYWAILLSLLLMPIILTLLVAAGVGVLVLSALVVIACVAMYPLAYINPRLYNYAMDD